MGIILNRMSRSVLSAVAIPVFMPAAGEIFAYPSIVLNVAGMFREKMGIARSEPAIGAGEGAGRCHALNLSLPPVRVKGDS